MTDEEKKAIELLEDYLICGNKEGVLCRNLRIIFTIIEKQTKEIEGLKEDNKKKSIVIIEYQDLYEKLVDKIKAKIEEIRKTHAPEDDYAESQIYILQSLLKKE